MNQVLSAVRLSKKELAFGGFSIFTISSMSIEVLFSSKGRREVVIALSSWFVFMLRNNNGFWFSRCSELVLTVFLFGVGFSNLEMKYGYAEGIIYVASFLYRYGITG